MTLNISQESNQSSGLIGLLTEMANIGHEEVRRVFVDGASCKEISGVGIVLISLPGKKIKMAIRLDFRASNNEAEYEYVLTGMRDTRDAGSTRVIIYSDSQLVTQQVKGSYEAR